MKIAILGSTGCIGTALLEKLADSEHQVVAFYRNNIGIEATNISWIRYDLSTSADLSEYLEDIDALYYFVHSLNRKGFEKIESEYAEKARDACIKARCKRIIYLGGILHDSEKASKHLLSRKKTGEALTHRNLEVLELRASIVLGECSDSYQIASKLAKRLPVMIAPKWLRTNCSPVYIGDLVDALVVALNKNISSSHEIINIGGDKSTYLELLVKMRTRFYGGEPIVLPTPFVALGLSSYWLGLITGANLRLARNLALSLVHDTSTSTDQLERLIGREPLSVEDSLEKLNRGI